MDLEYILSLAATALGLIVSVLTLLLKLCKNKKVRKAAEEMLAITNQLSTFVKEAEKFKNYTGEEKKTYVLTRMNQFSIDNNIGFDSSYVTQKLEELIETTKVVNSSTKEVDWLGN